jgi:hypothetical protein
MSNQVQISIDRDIYEQLQLLMVPPISDANAVIRELLLQEGHPSPAALAVGAREHHFTMAEELERSLSGVYTGGGDT